MEAETPEPAILAVILEDAERAVAEQDRWIRASLPAAFLSRSPFVQCIPLEPWPRMKPRLKVVP